MLSLSKDVEQALAALVLLARRLDSTSWEAGQVGQGCDIPPRTLDEILTRLVHQGLVSRVSGSPPRYTLGRRAVDISITDIVEAISARFRLGCTSANSARNLQSSVSNPWSCTCFPI